MKKFDFKYKIMRVVEEVCETAGLERKMVLLSPLWKYDYENRKIVETSPSTIYRDRLAKAAGLTPKEIMDEIKVRSKLLEILHIKNLTTLNEVTAFCRAYNSNPEEVMAKLGLKRKDLFPPNNP